ncbi:MAG TPA: AI-2E family transporter, partial [Spirochaetota bacterium]|nr:AI-2E family transporter [Spirochaetota bacterium]
HKLTPLAYKVIPFPRDVDVDIFGRIKNVVKVLIFGNILIMVLQGAMVGVGFLIFGVNVWMVGAAAAAVFSLIPGIGTSIVWIPAVAHLAYLGKSKEAFLLAAWSLFWYLFLENVVKPHVFGKKLNFHPILFFFLLIGSVMTFNLPGVIIGPVLLTIFFSLWEIYKFLDLYNSDKKIKSIKKR